MRRTRSPTHPASTQPRPARRIHEESAPKLASPTKCPRCGAGYRGGRWTWRSSPADAHIQMCPACERIRDDYPAGVLHVEGRFAGTHRDEIVSLIRNVEARERADHPLKRVMRIEGANLGFTVSTTDAKLVESMGRAIERAYSGTLRLPRTSPGEDNLVRVHWSRD